MKSNLDGIQIGEIICALRKQKNIFQDQLAKALNIPRTSISQIENGGRELSFIEFQKILAVFEMSFDEFTKMRPALLISSDDLIRRSNLISCAPFTGNINNVVAEDDILVKKDRNNNLFADSVLKAQHLSTFDKNRVKKYVGVLHSATLKNLKNFIIRNFNLQ